MANLMHFVLLLNVCGTMIMPSSAIIIRGSAPVQRVQRAATAALAAHKSGHAASAAAASAVSAAALVKAKEPPTPSHLAAIHAKVALGSTTEQYHLAALRAKAALGSSGASASLRGGATKSASFETEARVKDEALEHFQKHRNDDANEQVNSQALKLFQERRHGKTAAAFGTPVDVFRDLKKYAKHVKEPETLPWHVIVNPAKHLPIILDGKGAASYGKFLQENPEATREQRREAVRRFMEHSDGKKM